MKEKVKEKIIELSEFDEEMSFKNLKPEINNMLHTYLADNITIKQCDSLAMVIFDMMTNTDEYLK